MSIQVAVFFPLSYMSSSYIMNINPLLDIWFATIFSHFLVFHFVGFLCCVVFSLMQSHFILLPFFLVPNLKKHGQDWCQGTYLLSSSRSFMVSGINPHWVDFCVWCNTGTQFHPFACSYPVLLLKRLSFLHCIFWTPLPEINIIFAWLYFWTLLLALILCVCFYANTVLFWLL